MDWFDVITKVLPASVVVGGIAGYVGSWINWRIERRRMRIQHRQELVDRWRRVLLPALEGPQDLGRGTRKYPFMRTAEYASLRSFLSPEFVTRLERASLTLELPALGNFPRKQLMEEIARIEREWDLV